MITTMVNEVKKFTAPDEVRTVPNGRVELLHFGDHVIAKIVLQPGWRWSKDVKPIAKTEWCEAPHFQYAISGRLHFLSSDKRSFDFAAGDVLCVGGGHDAWVVGNEPFVAVDWAGMAEYAKE
ncbi:MAG: cupin domain-containing protein [Candidatus Brocadiia bacterium]